MRVMTRCGSMRETGTQVRRAPPPSFSYGTRGGARPDPDGLRPTPPHRFRACVVRAAPSQNAFHTRLRRVIGGSRNEEAPRGCRAFRSGSDGTRTRDLRRDRLVHRYHNWRRLTRYRSIDAGLRVVGADLGTIAWARFRAFAALLLPIRLHARITKRNRLTEAEHQKAGRQPESHAARRHRRERRLLLVCRRRRGRSVRHHRGASRAGSRRRRGVAWTSDLRGYARLLAAADRRRDGGDGIPQQCVEVRRLEHHEKSEVGAEHGVVRRPRGEPAKSSRASRARTLS